MIIKKCESCGKRYEAQRRDGKFCSVACRKRAFRKSKRDASSTNVITLAERPRERTGSQLTKQAQAELAALEDDDAPPQGGAVEQATRDQFDASEVLPTNPDSGLALTLARRLDHSSMESGSGIKALTSAYHAAIDRAMREAKKSGDALDDARDKIRSIRRSAAGA